jgi:tetratricopeptide (TPR) repeat protein
VNASPFHIIKPEGAAAPVGGNRRLPTVLTSACGKALFYSRKHWVRVLLLVIFSVAVRAPALTGDRIWDDDYLVHDNPFIKSPILILETFRHYLFPDSYSAHYRPVQNLSFMLDYYFWNTNTYGFHLTNVLLHAASGVLLYFLLRQLLASFCFRHVSVAARMRAENRLPWISIAAFWIAMIWAVHPVHSAAIDYISGRADSLAFLFAAAGWLLFLRAQRASGWFLRAVLYSSAATSGLVALLAREISCIWIGLFLGHLFFVERNCRRRTKVAALVCCLGLVAIYAGFRDLPEQRPPSPIDLRNSASERAVLMARALGDYGRLMIFPSNLHMERTVGFDPHFYQNSFDWRHGVAVEYLSIFGLFVLGALLFGCFKNGRGQVTRVFGATWFLIAYLPISNIVQLNATAAEHWLYLPSVGFLIYLFGWLFEFPQHHRRIICGVAALAVVSLSARSLIRSHDWSDGEMFYRHTFEAGSRSARVAINLGEIYTNRHDYVKAEKIFRSVLEQNPGYPVAQNNLASILYRLGKKKEAEKLFAELEKNSATARRDYPRTWIGALNLAEVRHNAGEDESAIAILDKARQDYPNIWDLIAFEAEILRKKDHLDRAFELVNNFARDNWWHYGAALALGRLYAQKGDDPRAEELFRHASRLDVHEAEALHDLALMRVHENRLDDAVRMQRQAVARQPDEPHQYILLSEILEKMGRSEEARAALSHVSKLRALADDLVLAN